MVCPKCMVDMAIQNSYEEMVNVGGENGDEMVRYLVQEFMCRNSRCEDFLRIVDNKRTRL